MQWFFHANMILQTFPCKMLFLGLNLEFPGVVFFDGEDGHQTFKKHTRLGVEGVRGGQKVCSCPRLGGLHGGSELHFCGKMNFCIFMHSP